MCFIIHIKVFNYIRRDVGCNNNYDVEKKIPRIQHMYNTISITL